MYETDSKRLFYFDRLSIEKSDREMEYYVTTDSFIIINAYRQPIQLKINMDRFTSFLEVRKNNGEELRFVMCHAIS